EMLRRAAVLDSMAPPPGSFLADLCEQHGVKFGVGSSYSGDQVRRLHENFVGYIKSINAPSVICERQKEIAYLAGELEKAQTEMESALLDRDNHRRFMQRLTSNTLWRMSWPLRALIGLGGEQRWRPK